MGYSLLALKWFTTNITTRVYFTHICSNHINYLPNYDVFVIVLTLAVGDSDMKKSWKLKIRGSPCSLLHNTKTIKAMNTKVTQIIDNRLILIVGVISNSYIAFCYNGKLAKITYKNFFEYIRWLSFNIIYFILLTLNLTIWVRFDKTGQSGLDIL